MAARGWIVAVAGAGRIDALVNCTAAAPAETFLEMTADARERVLKVNVRRDKASLPW